MGLTQKQAERFQQMAQNPDAVQAAMAKAREAGDVVSQAQIISEIQQAKKPHVTFNSGNNEWYTPADIINAPKAKERQAEYHRNQYESGLNQTFGEVQNETSQESKLTAKVENWYFGNFALS